MNSDIEFIVADIEDEALLGLDVLMKAEWRPADLRLSDGIMLLGGSCIHCTQIGQLEKVRKVRLAENYEILPSCEILIDVFVDRYDDDSPDIVSDLLLEHEEDFHQQFPVVMTPTLVDISQDVTNKVRILNPLNKKVTISQDTIIGEAEKLINEPKI